MRDPLRPKRWNLYKAAGIGAVVVPIYALGRSLLYDGAGYSWAYYVGGAIGGVAAGAVMFGLFAGLRNLVLRAQ